MNALDRYLVRTILGAVGMWALLLLALGALFLFIGQQDDIGVGNYRARDALLFVLLNLPEQGWQLLPIAALIGSLMGLGSLARGSEITVIRATGISPARIAGAALIAGAILIVIAVGIGEFLAPQLQQAAKQQKAFSKFADITFGGNGGAWVRDGNLIFNATRQSGERQFGGMTIFELSDDHRLLAIGHAARATAGSAGDWTLHGYSESRFTPERVVTQNGGERRLESSLGAQFLGLAVDDPHDMQIATLWGLIRYYQANALDARPYVFAFWSRIARTVAIAFAVLLPIPFVLGSLRSAGAGTRTAIGLMLGIGFFLLQRLIESGTLVFDLNPVVLAWLPTALLAGVSLTLLARAR
ncbi:MAG TPA: LPS export ABC transporter permease LptG [Steroidobacteraceae bacterium]|jgi:lipopolysaccharide export system permease protein|nr:LPS export ABC transporter permease LptG [Steroidobacteraceae bacterium]